MKYLMLVMAVLSTSAMAQLEEVVAFDQCPTRGTVLSDEPYCGGGLGRWTKWETVANGKCGTFMRRVEENSYECGYTPNQPVCPDRGTDLGIYYCGDPNGPWYKQGNRDTLYARIANGTCGSWRRTIEVEHPDCVRVEVTQVTETGDRFKPVTFEIFTPNGRDWTYEVSDATIGYITETPESLIIHGDGRIGEGTIVIEGEEYQYAIAPEPRCARNVNVDCLGYVFDGQPDGLIYYGEDDTQIVEWEIAFVQWAGADETVYHEQEILEVWTPENNPDLWYKYQEMVDEYNDYYERSGVFVRYVLKTLVTGHYHATDYGAGVGVLGIRDVDIILGVGHTCPNTCGCATPRRTFKEGTSPASSVSRCGTSTDLHEIGHSVGLAHGPNNSAYAGVGYVFPEFGHGDYSYCGQFDDIMSYGEQRRAHHNSVHTCFEQFGDIGGGYKLPEADYDKPAGDRYAADAAYHLNRVRYDVSLLHYEGMIQYDRVIEPEEELPAIPIVLDRVEDFENGEEMERTFMLKFRDMSRMKGEKIK